MVAKYQNSNGTLKTKEKIQCQCSVNVSVTKPVYCGLSHMNSVRNKVCAWISCGDARVQSCNAGQCKVEFLFFSCFIYRLSLFWLLQWRLPFDSFHFVRVFRAILFPFELRLRFYNDRITMMEVAIVTTIIYILRAGRSILVAVGGVARWLGRRCLAGALSLIYAWSMVNMWPLRG